MRVSKAELIVVEDTITREKERVPHTFFSLDASEMALYDAFRRKHADLESTLRQIRREGREMGREERAAREKGVGEMFLALVSPHIEKTGLKTADCFAGYGENKITFVETPYYALFEKDEPFCAEMRVTYWFSTKDATLSCTSKFGYNEKRGAPEWPLLHDLLGKAVGGREQDGTRFPIIAFRGAFVYFASSEFAIPIMLSIKDILKKVGPDAMEELKTLHKEYMNQSDSSLQQRVFKEAYERKLELSMASAGFIGQKTNYVRRDLLFN